MLDVHVTMPAFSLRCDLEKQVAMESMAWLRAMGCRLFSEERLWRVHAEGFAGSDTERVEDFRWDVAQEYGANSRLYVAGRGGWGAARLLLANPKMALGNAALLGFSDITTLLWQVAGQKQGQALHGPVLITLAREPEWSLDRLKRCLLMQSLPPLQATFLQEGCATGPLWVGNLCVATHMLGTPQMPDLTGGIVVFEEVNEPLYKIDRMLTHWALAGQLEKIAGFCFGRFLSLDQASDRWHALILEKLKAYGKPICVGLPVGHGLGAGNAVLPLGRLAHIDSRTGLLEVKEKALY